MQTEKTKQTRERLNALLQKTEGDIGRLGRDELHELQRLVSKEVEQDYRDTFARYYPKKGMIAALLHEEMHQRRVNRKQMCEVLGISREHFGKLLNDKARLGLYYAQIIHEEFGIDANFLLKNM